MRIIGKSVFILLILSLSISFAVPGQKSSEIPPKNAPKVKFTNDLAKDGRLSATQKLPILLVFSASDCSYCELLENEILKPMLLSGDYQDKVIIRKIDIDNDMVTDFNGKIIALSKIVSRYNIYVTPTMIFVDRKGKELTKRLIGINTVEYFGGDVDKAIEISLKKLNQKQYSKKETLLLN